LPAIHRCSRCRHLLRIRRSRRVTAPPQAARLRRGGGIGSSMPNIQELTAIHGPCIQVGFT
jgi:hypothetical protein